MARHDDEAPWTLEEERQLGDSLQQIIRNGSTDDEDEAAREIARRANTTWPGYQQGEDE